MSPPQTVVLTWSDDREETIRADRDQTVLEAAEAVGIALPFGCRTGACGICTGRKTAGSVSYVRPPRALKPRQREAGYVLCCIARPQTDCRITVGSSARAELISGPWR